MKFSNKSGFTLVETLIAVAIFVMISFLISMFIRNIFFLNADLNNSLSAQFDARTVLKKFTSEVRSASPGSTGAYTIAALATSSFSFYSDADNDGLKERIRYFLQGTDLKRGSITPSGSPLIYNAANEKLSTIATDVKNPPTTPIFDYFDNNYTGTSTPLVSPVDPLRVRLVRITLIIEKDSNRLPIPLTITTQVMLRNLKDNL